MKPVVGPFGAWFCTVVSAFGILILSVIGLLFNANHEAFTGSISDPEDGKAVAKTVFGAVFVYIVFFLFCGSQILLQQRESRIQL